MASWCSISRSWVCSRSGTSVGAFGDVLGQIWPYVAAMVAIRFFGGMAVDFIIYIKEKL